MAYQRNSPEPLLMSPLNIHSITQLPSVNSVEKIQALNALGMFMLSDVAGYAGARHAEFAMACFKQGNVENAGLENYIEAPALTADNLAHLDQLNIVSLISVSKRDAQPLEVAFGVKTLAQLAVFPPYVEAQQIVEQSIRGAYDEKPSAPVALIPKLIGSTHTLARYSNYVKEKEYFFDDYELRYFSDSDEPEPSSELLEIFYRAQLKFHLGYLASIHQKWFSDGTHLGEIIHSLALAPGESRNVAVLDWYRRQISSRDEETTISEQLRSEFIQTRALNEVVQTTANEHLYGSTSVDATTKTSGKSLVGGIGGGHASGESRSMDLTAGLTSLVGGALGSVAGSLGGANSALTSVAGSIGGSLVYSNGSVQGTLASETTGERTVTGDLVQNISDATVQNASNVRSMMSVVIVEDEQAGRQRAQTRNVTNYNHSHALTIQYYEVLHRYRTQTGVDSLSPVLFLPFGPITFTIELIKSYWYIFNKAIRQLQPGKAFEWNQVVKDFNPDNKAFDPSGDLRIERVEIMRSRIYSEPVRVEFDEANPVVTLAIDGIPDMDGCLTLKMTGSSEYIKYGVLGLQVFDVDSFFSGGSTVDSFEIDEGIKATLTSDFMVELKRMLKIYLGDEERTSFAPADTLAENLEDNELAYGIAGKSDRDNLQDDVTNDRFKIVNGDAIIDMTLNIEYTVADRNGETETVPQTIHKTYSYSVLKNEINEDITDVTTQINSFLATIADINQANVIAEIEDYFNFHKYGFTKYLLANLEKEQIKDVVEHLGISGSTETLALSALIDPAPVGIVENMLIFKLKEDAAGLHRAIGQNFFGWLKSPLFGSGAALSGNGLKQAALRNGRATTKYCFWGQPLAADGGNNFSTANLTLYVDDKPGKTGKHAVEGSVDLIQTIGNRQFTYPLVLTGTAIPAQDNHIYIDYTLDGAAPSSTTGFEPGTLDWTMNFPDPVDEDIAGIVLDYVRELDEYESVIRKRQHWAIAILPSSGVFAEAILGLSNASEYINVRRFFNWQDSPIPNLAPAIQAVNVNQDYSQPVPESLAPTVPVSVLNQIAPQQYPMPTSLTSALQAVQNGSMFTDMSKTDQFMSILGDLAGLANNTAQLSGNLAGDAAANALNSAVDLGKQVASMVGTAMNTNVADPPQTLTEIGSAWEQLDNVAQNSNGGSISPTDQAGMAGQGTPPPTGDTPGGLPGGQPPLQTITIGSITKDMVSPTRGQSDRYSIPRPGATNYFQRYFDVSFSTHGDVTITNAKAELLASNGGVLQTIVDQAPSAPTGGATNPPLVQLLDNSTLRVYVTFRDSVSQIASTPPPTDRIRYRFTLKGQNSNGDTIVSQPKESAEYYALWRMPDGFPRYSPTSGPRGDDGLDDWASKATYTWLQNNRTLVTSINDISGEHGRDIGHKTHYEGTDIDMFHVTTFPNGAVSGTENYLQLRANVKQSLNGDATALDWVNTWASDTRARFDSLIADNAVQNIIYAIGCAWEDLDRDVYDERCANQDPEQPPLTVGWAKALLVDGTYTNPGGLVINLVAGAWANADNPKMSYNSVHNNHFHVTLRP